MEDGFIRLTEANTGNDIDVAIEHIVCLNTSDYGRAKTVTVHTTAGSFVASATPSEIREMIRAAKKRILEQSENPLRRQSEADFLGFRSEQ